MNYGKICPFCGVQYNDSLVNGFEVIIYFFECGNAYDKRYNQWIDSCCNEPKYG